MSDRDLPEEGRAIISGPLPTNLANEIAEAIQRATDAGMEMDEAIGMTLQVAIDYARGNYGDAFALRLADFIRFMVSRPLGGHFVEPALIAAEDRPHDR